jgi:putative membrane protein
MMNDQRLTLLAIALSSTLTAGVAFSQTQTAPPANAAADKAPSSANSTLSTQDRKFVNTAGEAGAAEVAMGQLAESRSSSADVKGFAARMVSDHQKAGDELKAIASAKGAPPPSALSKKDQSELDKLSKLQGSDFDKEYVKTQLSAHKSAVSLFGSESKSGKDAQLKQFASTTLPTLQDHLQMVQQLSKTTKS